MISDGDDLPNPSILVRYVGFNKMRKDENDNIISPYYTAFEERPAEDYLSVTWCEHYVGCPDEQLRCAIDAIRNSNIDVRPKACFCIVNTEQLKAASAGHGAKIREVYLPEDDNPAHAGIYGISPTETILLEKLATETWSRFLTKDAADALPQSKCAKFAGVA